MYIFWGCYESMSATRPTINTDFSIVVVVVAVIVIVLSGTNSLLVVLYIHIYFFSFNFNCDRQRVQRWSHTKMCTYVAHIRDTTHIVLYWQMKTELMYFIPRLSQSESGCGKLKNYGNGNRMQFSSRKFD